MKPVEDRHTDPILTLLNDVRQETGYGWAEAFNDWVRVMFRTLRHDDEDYMELVSNYEDEYERDSTREIYAKYGDAFAELLSGTQDTHGDVLGEVHQKAGLGSEESGQYFTDGRLADAMRRMVMGDREHETAEDALMPDEEEIDKATPEDPYRVADPTCGSGRLLVAAGQRLGESGHECSTIFIGQDINPICARMAAINLSIHRLPGFITHGDSFALEPVASWKIQPGGGRLCGAPIYEANIAPFSPKSPTQSD